jgi:hypothetical protein
MINIPMVESDRVLEKSCRKVEGVGRKKKANEIDRKKKGQRKRRR